LSQNTAQSLLADEVHRSALILDTHADTPQRFLDEGFDFTGPVGRGSLSLDTARAGNLAGEFFAAWVEPTQWKGRFAHRALALIDAVHQQIRRHPDLLQLCTSPEDILAARASGRFAVVLSIEGGHAIENDLALLRIYHQLGIRSMTLTWSNSNEWADSSGDLHDPEVPHHNGLTPFGRDVVQEMNRLGMLVDVSHVSDQTFWQVLEISRAPVIASHSSARALTNSHRNLTDEMLRALAAKRGVAMANFYPAFIDEAWRQAWNAQRPEREAAHRALAEHFPGQPIPFAESNRLDREFSSRLGRAPLQSLIDHILHMVEVAGEDHVGIGTDFDGIPHPPEGIDTAADLPRITASLLAHGLPPATLHKLLGGNLMRVFREVQRDAQALPSSPVME
jgi:membrane dipeptidase